MKGLIEILAKVYSEGRQPNQESGEEIIRRLEEAGNYIPSSYSTRREYRYALLIEYRAYIAERGDIHGPKLESATRTS